MGNSPVQFSSELSRVLLFATPWTTACQASLSITKSRSLLKLMSIELVMPSNHLILCRPLLLLPSIFPSIRVFSNESVLHVRWPKYWSFSFSISHSKEYSGLISFRMDWLDLLVVQGTLKNLLQHRSSKASILRHSSFLYSPTLTSMESQRVGHNLATNTFTFYLVHGSLMVHNGLVSLVLPPLTDEAEGKRGWVTAIGCAACKRWGSRVSPICSKNLVLIWLAARTFSSLCRSKQTIFPDPDQTLPSLSWDFFFFSDWNSSYWSFQSWPLKWSPLQ